MIRIQVTSEMVECVRTFKADRPSITFLKRIKKLHELQAEYRAGPKPHLSIREKREWRKRVAENAIPVKVEITHVN